MNSILIQNANVLSTITGGISANHDVFVQNGRIIEVGQHPLKVSADNTLNARGRFLMPGLCDAHVHVTAVTPNFAEHGKRSPSYVAARSSRILQGMLHRGFTTVRDAGGADHGLADAVEEGYFKGPRLLVSGHALSQTGGHGDMRVRGDDSLDFCPSCTGRLGRICDGVTEVRRAARDELRKGAKQIKIMASGGIASPTDHIENTQFSLDEIKAIVEEATAARTYVMAHAYTSRAVMRAIECGVRSIEHGNLIDEECARQMKERGCFLVPTLSTYETLFQHGRKIGLPEYYYEKLKTAKDAGLRALEIAHRLGLKIVYGTDLLGELHQYQCLEFSLRSEIQPPFAIIQSATVLCAEIFNMNGEIGVIAPGARADILLINGNPLEDLNFLQDPDRHLVLIMKDGEVVVNRL